MIAELLASLVLVLGVAFGIARPVADRLGLRPVEAVVAGAALSLVAAFAVLWAVFTLGLPLGLYWLVPAAAAAGIAAGWRGVAALLRDGAARELMGCQLMVTAWCASFLALLHEYTGGAWIADWYEHWERAGYFLRLWPADRLFIGRYLLPARPPLANLLVAGFMRMTSVSFPMFQSASTALCSLAFLPAGLLAWRFGGRRGLRMSAVAFMASPLFIQNATYPWTKLEAAFFVLCALYFVARMRDGGRGSAACGLLAAVCLAGGILAHYSAGPYAAVLALSWILLGVRSRWALPTVRLTLLSAAAGAAVLALWFGWSVTAYGARVTFLSNSTAEMAGMAPMSPLLAMLLNIRDTLVPAVVRGFHGRMFVQANPWGAFRDHCFLLYQLDPVLAMGSVACLVAARGAARAWAAASRADRAFWTGILLGIFLLSFAAYGDRDRYGIGHLCLQGLVLLGVAFAAAQWDSLGRGWRAALCLGWCADFCLGVALQAGLEGMADPLRPGRGLAIDPAGLSLMSQENIGEKMVAHLAFVADTLPIRTVHVLLLLGALLLLALVRARGQVAADPGP
ncbi:MAG TPA: hypothetical protein VGG34_00915 [Opitutaceae bacterium]|jgi:hypothetical protein